MVGVGASTALWFTACREPTQITLVLTTDARCPAEAGEGASLIDTLIASGIALSNDELVGQTVTDRCEVQQDDNLIGTLVLLPSGGDEPGVHIAIVAGVATPGGSAQKTADDCRALVESGSGIAGEPCIVARRRLAFIEHVGLTLPIKLDSRCIGVDCSIDKTCFNGNCVSSDVDCSEGAGCADLVGCDLPCHQACISKNGACEDGACLCLACDEAACAVVCPEGQSGVCEDDICLCKSSCDPPSCDMTCAGTCQGPACLCETCDPDACADVMCPAGSGAGQCVGDPPLCACVGVCDPTTCMGMDCPGAGQIGLCQQLEQGPACVCTCNDSECFLDCGQDGGTCVDGACSCNPACSPSDCAPSCLAGQTAQCISGGCVCLCDEIACDNSCGPGGGYCDVDNGCYCNGATVSSGGPVTASTTDVSSSSTGGSCIEAWCDSDCYSAHGFGITGECQNDTCHCICDPATCIPANGCTCVNLTAGEIQDATCVCGGSTSSGATGGG